MRFWIGVGVGIVLGYLFLAVGAIAWDLRRRARRRVPEERFGPSVPRPVVKAIRGGAAFRVLRERWDGEVRTIQEVELLHASSITLLDRMECET